MITSTAVLRIFGHIIFFFLFIGVPPFLVNIVKDIRFGSKSASAPFGTGEWIALIILYLIAGYLYIFRWILA